MWDTDYVMTYHKPANSPQLLAKSFPRKEDRRVSMTFADFLTTAWKLAKDKATVIVALFARFQAKIWPSALSYGRWQSCQSRSPAKGEN
jgi:hypothetical protein